MASLRDMNTLNILLPMPDLLTVLNNLNNGPIATEKEVANQHIAILHTPTIGPTTKLMAYWNGKLTLGAGLRYSKILKASLNFS